MKPESPDPDARVRVRITADGRVRLLARETSLDVAGHRPSDEALTSLELLLGALAAELVAGLRRESARDGIVLDETELNVSARLESPLVALGVIGEQGSPRIASIRGSLYVSTDAEPEALERAWMRARERAPVHATLTRSCELAVELKTVV
jgi:uncharacterized OsmC-like protein